MFETPSVESKQEILDALAAQGREIGEYLAGFPSETFLAPQGEHWSPEGHLQHLVKSVRAVVKGLGMPRPLLMVLFGLGRGGSRSFQEVEALYLEALGSGAQAGRFGPAAIKPGIEPDEWRRKALERWDEAVAGLVALQGPDTASAPRCLAW